MATSEIAIERKLSQFIKGYADDQCCLELLRFFGKHPYTRVGRLVSIPALNGQMLSTQQALKRLMDDGVIKVCTENSVPRYSLTEEEPLRSMVLSLAELKWCQWQPVLG